MSAAVVTISVSPATLTLASGLTTSFVAAVGGTSNKAVTWSAPQGTFGTPVVDATGSTVSWTAPPAAATVTITAQSQADPTKVATSAVTVTSDPIQVTVSPSTISLAPGEAQSFSATVTGTTNTSVSWHANGGTPTDTTANPFTWTAPSTLGTYTLTATSVANPSRMGSATVTVAAPVVTVSPATISLGPGGTQTFTATVANAQNQAVTWSVVEWAAGGTITSGGAYTAPTTAGTYHVKAVAVVDPTKSATATITVTAPSVPALIWKRSSVYAFGTLISEDTTLDGTIYIQGDQVGSPTIISNSAGIKIGESKNLPFGERFGSTGTKSSRRYTNHEDQPGSAIYMQARMYLPAYGKFAQVDPAYDQTKDDPESWNLYGYVTNNPVTHSDPDGRTQMAENNLGLSPPIDSEPGGGLGWYSFGFQGDWMDYESYLRQIGPYLDQPRNSTNSLGITLPGGGNGVEGKATTAQTEQTTQTNQGGTDFLGAALMSVAFGTVPQDKAATASLMTDDHGNVVMDARGGPALMPVGFTAQQFVASGEKMKDYPVEARVDLSKFKQGGPWDLQRLNGKFDSRFTDGATIAIGLYASAAGIPFKSLMTIQNDYAAIMSTWKTGTPMDQTWTHLPIRNVTNTAIGYRLYENGLVTGQ